MAGPSILSQATGWRRALTVNIVLLALLFAALLTATFFVGQETQSFVVNYFFHAGDCARTRMLNLLAHLALNVAATLVFAAACLVMQVVNAPTRPEIDAAHSKGKFAEIGVPSVRNLMVVSGFKVFSWVFVAACAFPLHMVLNSAVFMTDFHGRGYNVTVAAEPFVTGAPFFPPGASLAAPGFESGYGTPVNISKFLNETSRPVRELRAIAETAAKWTMLDPVSCRTEYLSCHPREAFKDLVIVVNTAGNPDTRGWTRDEVFDLSPQAAASWDQLVPAGQVNSLWFSAVCEVAAKSIARPDTCMHSCGRLLGRDVNLGENGISEEVDSPNWTIPFQGVQGQPAGSTDAGFSREGFRFDQFNDLEVRYCLAQEFQPTCRLGVSPLFLGISALCVAFIATQSLLVLRNLTIEPLVTPGDAIASFIRDPDPTTDGMSTLTFQDKTSPLSRLLRRNKKKKTCIKQNLGGDSLILKAPREWSRGSSYVGLCVSATFWLRMYIFHLFSLGVLVFSYFRFGRRATSPGAFLHSPENGRMHSLDVPDGSFVLALLMANKPQVFLAICYFNYNALLTRFMAESEWNGYSRAYAPLRVTRPKGSQVSTYRLQLPYTVSVPLVVSGMLLHWVLSNAYYLGIFEGGYYGDDTTGLRNVEDDVGFDPGTIVALSYSVKALLAISIVSFILALVPLFIAFLRLKGDMVVAGANSRVISAACHPRPSFVQEFNAPYSPWSARSPWQEKGGQHQQGAEAQRLVEPVSPGSRSPTDTRSIYRPRAASDAKEEENWPLPAPTQSRPVSAWTQDSLVPPSPYERRGSGDGRVSLDRRGSHDRRVTMYRPRAASDAQSIDSHPASYNSRPPSTWGRIKFEPNHQHDQPPPTPELEPPSTPWISPKDDEDDKVSPLVQTIRLNENRRRTGVPSLSIVTPSSPHSGRKLPWVAEKHEPIPIPTPVAGITTTAASLHGVRFKGGSGERAALTRLSRRKLRWGAIPVIDRSTSLQFFPEKANGVGHLSFGTVENGVVKPEVGKVYE